MTLACLVLLCRTRAAAEATRCWSHFICLAGSPDRTEEISMFLTIFVILLVLWLLGLFAFHVAGGLIHLLLIIAVISLVMHFMRSRSAA